MYIYNKLPVFFQNIVCTLYGCKQRSRRFGQFFEKEFSTLKKSQFYNEEQIYIFQNRKLHELIQEVYQHVPYYRNLFKQLNLQPEDISNVEDLNTLPVLTKKLIKDHQEDFIDSRFNKNKLISFKTSGSTGTPLELFRNNESISSQWAVWWRHRNRFGVSPNQWHVNFTVRPVVPITQKNPPFWRWDYARKQLIINMQSLNKDNVYYIAKCIDRYNFDFFTGPPSILFRFGSLLNHSKVRLKHNPSVIFTGAESLYDYQKDLLETTFECTVTDQYGFTEACGNASKCEYGYFHEDFEFGILECEDPKLNDDGSYTGNILATGFTNKAFPLIRYRVGDIATWMPDDFDCPCGRKSKVIKHIDGRIEDYIVTPEGNMFMRFGYLFKDLSGIEEAQIVQRKLGEITIRIITNNNFSQNDIDSILKKVNVWVSPSIKVRFEKVDELQRTTSGKLPAIISLIDEGY